MKLFYAIAFGLAAVYGFSQTVSGVVLDSLTKQPVPFANIVLPDRDFGVSADENGKFILPVKGKVSNIVASSVGYKNKQVASGDCITVYLSPRTEELGELVINAAKKHYTSVKTLGLNLKAKVRTSLGFGGEFSAFIKNPYHEQGKLIAVLLDLQKDKKMDYIATYNVRFYRYDRQHNCPGEELYNKHYLVYPENKSYTLRIPVEDLNVPFPPDGICIGVEVINTLHKDKLKPLPRVGPMVNFTHTDKSILSWSRYRNKDWHIDTRKSPVRPDFINALINIEVVIEK